MTFHIFFQSKNTSCKSGRQFFNGCCLRKCFNNNFYWVQNYVKDHFLFSFKFKFQKSRKYLQLVAEQGLRVRPKQTRVLNTDFQTYVRLNLILKLTLVSASLNAKQ